MDNMIDDNNKETTGNATFANKSKQNKKRFMIGIVVLLVATGLIFVFRCQIFGHQYTDRSIEPTCTTEGFTQHTCDICGNRYQDDVKPVLPHSCKYTSTATCTKSGEKTGVCINCDYTYTEKEDALGHSYSEKITQPTCGSAGKKQVVCSRCNDVKSQTTLAATGEHSYNSVITSQPTCTKKGTVKELCKICGKVKSTKSIAAKGHNWLETKCSVCYATNPEVYDKKVTSNSSKDVYRVYMTGNTFKINGTYSGSGHFAIVLLDANKDWVELIANDVGSQTINETVYTTPGYYYIEVQMTRGSYSLTWYGTYGDK